MSVRYDEKGKIFTDIVSKEPQPSIIQTPDHCIHGSIHVRPDNRTKDVLDEKEAFLAVTDAVVYDSNQELLYRCSFIAINRASIVWVIPKPELQDDTNNGGGSA